MDLGDGYFLDCSFYDKNLSENVFRKKFRKRFNVANIDQLNDFEINERMKEGDYKGFDNRINKKNLPHYNISPFKYVHIPNYELFYKQSHSNLNNLYKDYTYLIKEFFNRGKMNIIPKKINYKTKEIKQGTIEELDELNYQEDEEYPRLTYTKEEAQSLHLKIPSRLDESSIHGFSGHQSGVLLWGQSGVGKSGTLLGLSVWGYYNDWIVLKIPSVFELTQNNNMPKDGFKAFEEVENVIIER